MKDIVAIRKYNDKNGEEKVEFINVGYMFEKEGKTRLLFKNRFNLNSFSNDKGEIWLNAYEHKQKTQDNSPKTQKDGGNTHPHAEAVKVIQGAVNGQEDLQGTQVDDADVPF